MRKTFLLSTVTFITATSLSLVSGGAAQAQSAGGDDAQIAALQQQLRVMQQKLDSLQKQTSENTSATAKATAVANANAKMNSAYPVKGPVTVAGAVVTMPNNRPTICTADQENCISFTSRLHLDAGDYDYRPNSSATSPQRLDDGVNARRARIGVIGKFMSDWNYALIYDFGGTSDGFGGSATTGSGTSVGLLPGGATSGIENAYLSYTGFNPFGGKLAIEGGYMDVPYTLDEATSSNDILFMERSSSQAIATSIAAGDNRSTFGSRWYNDVFWAGVYATGPTSGAIHSVSSVNPVGVTEQNGVVARAAGQIVSGKDYSIHIGGDAEFLIDPSHAPSTGASTLTLSDRPELRIDPTSILSTGSITGVSGAQVYSAEAAAAYGPLFFQGEYYAYHIDRDASLVPTPDANFKGGYGEASFVLTGETHTYNTGTAAYNGIVPTHPFSIKSGGWGAWEVAGRFSQVDLNDQLGTATGVAGGKQTVYTAGLNWYVNRNIRFMFDYLHGDIDKQASATSVADVGAKFDAFAMRTQIAF